jgi:hypothetical protein
MGRKRQTTAPATSTKAIAPSVAEVPWPGARANSPVTVSTAPNPTAGSSHDHPLLPADENTARPTSSETAQINAAEA